MSLFLYWSPELTESSLMISWQGFGGKPGDEIGFGHVYCRWQQLTVCDTNAGFPSKWRLSKDCRNSILMTFTTQILVVLLYDTTNEKHYRDLGSERHKNGISTFCGATSGGVAKCQLFSHVQAGETVACESIRFSSLFAAGDVSFRAKRPRLRRARRNGCFRRLGKLQKQKSSWLLNYFWNIEFLKQTFSKRIGYNGFIYDL